MKLVEQYGRTKRISLSRRSFPDKIPLIRKAFYDQFDTFYASRTQSRGWEAADFVNEEAAGMFRH